MTEKSYSFSTAGAKSRQNGQNLQYFMFFPCISRFWRAIYTQVCMQHAHILLSLVSRFQINLMKIGILGIISITENT